MCELQANQFRVAEARGVEAVVAAMKRFPHQATVQLSALLCFIPLALENIMMQVCNRNVGLMLSTCMYDIMSSGVCIYFLNRNPAVTLWNNSLSQNTPMPVSVMTAATEFKRGQLCISRHRNRRRSIHSSPTPLS